MVGEESVEIQMIGRTTTRNISNETEDVILGTTEIF